MRRWRTGLAVLLAGLVVSVSTAQDAGPKSYSPTPTVSGNWWQSLFGGSDKPKPKVVDRSEIAQPLPPAQDNAPSSRAHDNKRSEMAYFRRLAVCDRLREIALRTNDQPLADEADRLADQAFEIYQRQLGVLGSGAQPSASATLSGQGRPAGGADVRTAGVGEGKR
jgi:hypothetical protein